MQTRYCIEPPPSMAVLIRRAFIFVQQRCRRYAYFQKPIDDAGKAKGVRFDVWAKDCNGRIYDIEMLFSDRHPCLSENTSFAIRQNVAAA